MNNRSNFLIIRLDCMGFYQWWTRRDRDVFENNIAINDMQPGSVKAFTKEGFLKQPIPQELNTAIQSFYKTNNGNPINEGTGQYQMHILL